MTEQTGDPIKEAIGKVLRGAVQNVIKAGRSPEEIRSALGLSGTTNLLHVEGATTRVEIDSPDGLAYFARESGPSWVQYRDHRPKPKWEEDVVLPVEFDPSLPINVDVPGERGGEG